MEKQGIDGKLDISMDIDPATGKYVIDEKNTLPATDATKRLREGIIEFLNENKEGILLGGAVGLGIQLLIKSKKK